jgi:chorismate dehydratase
LRKLRISAVSYLNTKPFLYGLVDTDFESKFEIELAHPAACAEKLKCGDADIGLVPIALAKEMPGGKIISKYCIGTEGSVRTVCLFSQVPMDEIKSVVLDYQSKTSVALIQYLMKNYWQKEVKWEAGSPGFENRIGKTTAGLVIGDRTIDLFEKHPYCYDLGEIWRDYTGLPFVFAVWMTYKDIDEDLLVFFNQALQLGIEKIDSLVYLIPPQWKGPFDVAKYLKENISYSLDEAKIKGMNQFLKAIGVEQLPQVVPANSSFLVN